MIDMAKREAMALEVEAALNDKFFLTQPMHSVIALLRNPRVMMLDEDESAALGGMLRDIRMKDVKSQFARLPEVPK
jgi:hypothetical protein